MNDNDNNNFKLESTQDLPPDDKDKMLRVLNQTLRTGRKRLEAGNEQMLDGAEAVNNNTSCAPIAKQK